MFQLTEIVSLFLFFIFLCFQEEYEDVCFIILGEKEKDVNLKFNKNLNFVPDYLKIDISTTENLYDKKLDEIKRNTFILAKANNSCSDPFGYEVPWSSQMILTLNMVIYWGENPSILIDENEMVVRPEFESSIHEWKGLLNYISLKIFLKHEKLNRNYLQQESYLISKIDWNGKVRALLPGESYCLSLFTLYFFGILIFSQIPVEREGILKYYRLNVNVLGKNDDIFMPNELSNIANVFPCNLSLALKDRLKIFIKPKYYKIQLKLFGEVDMPVHIAEYGYHRGRFKLNTTSSNFSFTYFEIKPMTFSIDMFTRKAGMLIYMRSVLITICKARIPENIDKLKVSRKLWLNIDKYMVRSYCFKVDMSTQEVGVYKIIGGSESEFLEMS